jgi:hypothetical protein
MAADLRAVRLEIAEQEERIEGATTTRIVPGVPRTKPDVAEDETAPAPAPTLLVQRKSPAQKVSPSDDYDLRSHDEIAASVSRAQDSQASPSRKRRWLLVLGTGVAAAVALGVSIVLAWPQLLFRDNRPPQFRLTSVPEGANIIVNGLGTGLRTPADVQLAELPASIRLELSGYEAFVTQVTEESAGKPDRVIRASLVEVPPPPPPPLPAPVEPEPTPPPPPPPAPAPRPLAELKVLRAPGQYAFCSASIGRSWNGSPFDGVTSIRLPAQRYPIRIECSGQPTAAGEILVPPGKNDRNFNEVVTLKPSSEPTVPR